VDRRATLAIGDQLNDLEMITDAGIGVAMGGAPEAVRAAASIVAPPIEEEGAAQVLEELLLGGPAGRSGSRPGGRTAGAARTVDGGIGHNGPAGSPEAAERGRSRE
jgi:hypothetical protein